MEDKDIVGKEFTVFKFDKFKSINWESNHDKYIGGKGLVKNIHCRYPEYAYVHMETEDGKYSSAKHFPTHMIREQLEEMNRENKSVDDLLLEMKQLISRL